MQKSNIEKFLKVINYKFKDSDFLKEALTHPSCNSKNGINYQRFEFLGDSVLSLLIAEILFKTYPKENEGKLSKRQAYLVSGKMIASIASKIGLGEVMIFSKNEEDNGGRDNKSNLENGLEALIGAIYLDSNLEECRNFIVKFWQNLIKEDLSNKIDPVSHLQEIIQAKSRKLPKYSTSKTGGNEHEPVFTSIVEIDGKRYAATGSSKKEAQKEVAKHALEIINQAKA